LVVGAVCVASAIGCGAGASGTSASGQQGLWTCSGTTDTAPLEVLPDATKLASLAFTETPTGLMFPEMDVGPYEGFSCVAKNVVATFNATPTGTTKMFQIGGFACVTPDKATLGLGGFGFYDPTRHLLSFDLINFEAPIVYMDATSGHLNCSFLSPPPASNDGGAAGATSGGGGHSGAGGGSSGADAAASCADGGASGWTYVVSCDWTTAGIIHSCSDTYTTASLAAGIATSQRSVCTAMQGTILSAPCATDGSLGSCIITGSSGATATSPTAEYQRLYMYAGAPNVSADTARAACTGENGTYEVPGAAADAGVPAVGASTLACAPASGDGGTTTGFAFAVATVVNGQVVQCTNFSGTTTAAQRNSIVAIGGMLTPCPAMNAVCACRQPAGSGTFGTDATAVTYTTALSPQTGCGADASAACSPTYTPP